MRHESENYTKNGYFAIYVINSTQNYIKQLKRSEHKKSDVLWQIFFNSSIKWVHILEDYMAIFDPLFNLCSQTEHEQST